MPRLTLILLLSLLTPAVKGQECAELLSQAEQDYRNGLLEVIVPKICKCFGIYRDDKKGEIKPVGYKVMMREMKNADSMYPQQLGPLLGYWVNFVNTKSAFKQKRNKFFKPSERNRAFVLLGKLYDQLGAIRLSEYFALRAILIEPDVELANDSLGFNRTYSEELDRVRQWSVGPYLGWLYVVPAAIQNNGGYDLNFRYQSTAKIVLGAQFKYFFKPTIAINAGYLINSATIVYTEKRTSSQNDFDFYHEEKQDWVRIPALFQISSVNKLGLFKNENGKPIGKLFFGGGFAVDYLSRSYATIVDVNGNHVFYAKNVTDYRNRVNLELILQVFAQFGVGRNYVNIGFTGSYLLRDIVKQDMVTSNENPLYATYGIKENNYKLMTGCWTVTYDFMFNRLRKKKPQPTTIH
ncbi:hypothetical protein [Flavitalea sp.]|nr:hypothetical protein [Flavitalea sp.]